MSEQDQNSKKQWQRALEMLREGPASALALWHDCGIYRASDAIFTMRQYGYDVETTMIDFVTTRGYKVKFARYTLVSEARANARKFRQDAQALCKAASEMDRSAKEAFAMMNAQ